MKILVVDVAAEAGGALSVLNRHIEAFRGDRNNEYIVCVSQLDYEDTANVRFLKFPWVKKSYLHRLYFDMVSMKQLVRKHRPDRVFSLQNKGFEIGPVEQEVFFHNALFICEKRFSFRESRIMWVYQNVISILTRRSLKRVSKIYVQAEWIRQGLAKKWAIDPEKIVVERPQIQTLFQNATEATYAPQQLFYPASGHVYKNHLTLLQACAALWEKNGSDVCPLALTGSESDLSEACRSLIKNKNYPIHFLGKLSPEEMRTQYLQSVLVFPSYIETAGLPLLEAKNLGCKIIAADCEYAHEVLDGYKDCCYVDWLSPDVGEGAIETALREISVVV